MTERTQLGFTLLELLITIAVIGVLAASAYPILDVIDKRRVQGAAEDIYGMVQFARSEAIKQSRDMFLVAQKDGSAWCVGVSQTSGCSCTVSDPTDGNACIVSGAIKTISSTEHPQVSMTSSALNITFDHVRGTATASTITLAHATKTQWSLSTVVSPLGRVRISVPAGATPMGGYKQ